VEEKYWQQFLETGKITDYLYYKGMQIISRVMDSYEGNGQHEPDYGDGHGARGDACRGI